jgi:hypothetical protein
VHFEVHALVSAEPWSTVLAINLTSTLTAVTRMTLAR